MSTHVLIGATFACDAALALPLELLLKQKLPSQSTTTEWLPYASAADFAAWEPRAHGDYVDLVVLLVRVSDLDAAHPELCSETSDSVVDTLVSQLKAYDSQPPLVVLFCPSPPLRQEECQAKEDAVMTAIADHSRRIDCRPSTTLVALFEETQDVTQWYDARGDKRQHAPYTQSMLNAIALSVTRQVARLERRPKKKVIVLDCDNTLWGGAVADVGVQGVELSQRFLALQRFVVAQQQRGMLLALCSKNLEQDVVAVFTERREELVLQLHDHIVTKKINWRPKADNIREMATELGLGLDAFVFVDDNPVECHDVASALPMVTVVHVPRQFTPSFLNHQWAFDTTISDVPAATTEDQARTRMYQQNVQRHALERKSTSPTAFLSSLSIRIQFAQVISPETEAFARVLQLHQRTNTFNVAVSFARALTAERLDAYVSTPGQYALAATVTDRFGHYGLVCVALCRCENDGTERKMVVDSFLLSCRTLNRDVEHAMLNKIAEVATKNDVDVIQVAWEPTERNEPARCFFSIQKVVEFVPVVENQEAKRVVDRHEKTQRSAVSKGVWRMTTQGAAGLSFLAEVALTQANKGQLGVWNSSKRVVMEWIARFFYKVMTVVHRWMPEWLFALVRAVFRFRSALPSSELEAVRYDHHTSEDLDDFVKTHLSSLNNADSQQIQAIQNALDASSPAEEDGETDEMFRLRSRQETKVLLLDHVTEDNPRVVWAPNRQDSLVLDVDEDVYRLETSSEPSTEQFHRFCATSSCTATVFWQSHAACAFQRCRACCYRIQRLLMRATSDKVHAKARKHAQQSLQDDFGVELPRPELFNGNWCGVHQNEKKRKS
ncbi:hypothetical protein Poli38472_014163 [Pythium oligandrum]|uniref:FCP1 homology domain-containing protein n=1 Tax=Pythium oligandrum TaxID=41045 RepID=A0A8K1CJV4_PYTOL|nr:hypothetical protein Poli38472_014163 [Pythium oligandrum]|eukprot:TMW64046.1 hypothetical protein Poli38472_014163 [Pythium oligandrum]